MIETQIKQAIGFLDMIFQQGLRTIFENENNFSDSIFPPTESSIGEEKSKKNNEKLKYEWRRINEILPENYFMRIIKNENELIDDVIQGDLGDCYFLCALSAFAERSLRIKKLFEFHENSPTNTSAYIVNAYIDGKPFKILLDNYFPVTCKEIYTEHDIKNSKTTTTSNNLAFSNVDPVSKNIWPLILEKAWAKCNGSYKNIVEGTVSQAFEFLTCAPVELKVHPLDHEDKIFYSELLDSIKYADRKDHIICGDVSDNNGMSIPLISSIGLLCNHAYSIISVHEVNYRGDKVSLLKIRNPWGRLEWNGDWSDNSKLWTPEIRKLLDIDNKDDGMFFMSFKDYCKFFTSTYICKYEVDYNYSWKEFNFDKNEIVKLISIKIDEDSKGYFSLFQKISKIYKNLAELNNFTNPYASFILIKNYDKGKENRFIGSCSGKSDRISLEVNLERGEYTLIVKFPKKFSSRLVDFSILATTNSVDVEKSDSLRFVIGYYSSCKGKITIAEKQSKRENEYEEILFNSLVNLAEESEKDYFFQEGEPSVWRYMKFNTHSDSSGYLIYKNNSQAIINETLCFSSLENFQIFSILQHRIVNERENDFYEENFENNLISRLAEFEHNKIRSICTFNLSSSNEINLTIAPMFYIVLIFEKLDEYAELKFESLINLQYLVNFLWAEKKFSSKKQRIKYHDNTVDIFESIIRHPGGVLFKYKNKSKDLKFQAKIKLHDLDNIQFNNEFEHFYIENNITDVNYYESEKSLVINLSPGNCIFADFICINKNNSFSFSTEIDYEVMVI